MKQVFLVAAVLLAYTGVQAQQNPEKNFLKRNPSVKSIHWKEKGTVLVLTTKSGATETYQLNKKETMTAFTRKYGGLPVAPPPLPPVPPPAPPVPPVPDTETI